MASFEELTVPAPDPSTADWNNDGVVVMKNFFPEDLMVAYEQCWREYNTDRPGGWPDCTPYRRHPELFNMLTYGPLGNLLESLIGEPAGVHLNLTGWVSTERDWHQDAYLNPAHVGDYYAAVWIALDDIHPDSGPFQYVPGSHRWRQVTQKKILAALNPDERDHRWPKYSERILTPLFEAEIERQGVPVVSHIASRGDLLVWHGRLMHRGSKANVYHMERRALIAHYSGINHRGDMPKAKRSQNGGWFLPLDDPIDYAKVAPRV
jgi:hypothetical protein